MTPVTAADPLAQTDEDLLVEAFGDAESYRALALAALGLLYEVKADRDRLRGRYHASLDELRQERRRVT